MKTLVTIVLVFVAGCYVWNHIGRPAGIALSYALKGN